MAKEYIASKYPGGNRVHIWDDDASFDEYCYGRELVEKPEEPKPVRTKVTTHEEFIARIDEIQKEINEMIRDLRESKRRSLS